ncbi:hypothetical protein ARTHRO9AX_210209 [Arthrobacter sp. 9AX]|nr:hypothetical protein ARTHRO9AX_210209 [Arthrobacter sp. 9AX]
MLCNIKLRDVAVDVIESVSPDPALRTHFDDDPRHSGVVIG